MKTPKELTGKVEKIENSLIFASDGYLDQWYISDNVVKFYTQPFKPKMIEEYFEEASITQSKVVVGVFEGKINGYIIEIIPVFGSLKINQENILYPKTLSDFIDACINSGIKLKWRNK